MLSPVNALMSAIPYGGDGKILVLSTLGGRPYLMGESKFFRK